MKSLGKVIIAVAILIFIVIIAMVVLKIIGERKGSTYQDTEFEQQIIADYSDTIKEETDRNKYYATINIINNFVTTILDGDNIMVYNILEPQYVQEYGITEDNVLEKLNMLNDQYSEDYQANATSIQYKADKLYRIQTSSNITIYFAYGNIVDKLHQEEIKYNLIVEMDSANQTYYIVPQDYMEKNNYTNPTQITSYNISIEQIQNNGSNKFQFTNVDDEDLINNYLNNYEDEIVNNLSDSYLMLDEDYRNARFGTVEEYENYMKDNMQYMLSIVFTKYKREDKDGYTEYICIDKDNNYYIFKEKAVMDYSILLDNYTIDSDEFLDKYKNADLQTKVGLNCEKIVQALNLKDYKYIYNKLDETFKNSNFDSLDKFTEYMSTNYPDRYQAEYSGFKKESDLYIQPITLNPISGEGESKQNNIIMQLKDGTDFVISFNIE